MGAQESKAQGQQDSNGADDYYSLLEVSEMATADEIKVSLGLIIFHCFI